MISYNVPINAQRMTIGVQGENNVREFLFDVTEWRQLTGNIGAAEMVVQRAGDSSPYATVITMKDENTVSWVPTSVDTAKVGAGKIQLMWFAGTQIVKTKIFDMKVDPALDYKVPDDSLDPWASWMPGIINADANYKGLTSRVDDLQQRQTSPYNFKGAVAALGDLPSTGQEVNDTYYVEAVKYRVTWTGSAWQQSSMDEEDYEDELAGLKSDVGHVVFSSRPYLPSDVFSGWTFGAYNANTGKVEERTDYLRTPDLLPVVYGQTVTVKLPATVYNGISIVFYDKDRQFLSGRREPNKWIDTLSETAPQNAVYFGVATSRKYSEDIDPTLYADAHIFVSGENQAIYHEILSGMYAALQDDAVITSAVRALFKVGYNYNGAETGAYSPSSTRNAIIYPISFPFDVIISVDTEYSFAAQYYSGPIAGPDTYVNSEWWHTNTTPLTVPAGTWFCLNAKSDDDAPASQSITDAIHVRQAPAFFIQEMEDSRVGADGTKYLTTGEHIRALAQRILPGNSYVITPELLRRPVSVTSLGGKITQTQAFCIYNDVVYSTNGTYITGQSLDLSSVVLDKRVETGHGNNFQLGSDNLAYISGWNDNKIYCINMDSVEIERVISLPTTGYTTAVVDDVNQIAYIFQRDTSPSTQEHYNFIVYDIDQAEVIRTRKINAFAAMQSADYIDGKIVAVWGLGTAEAPSGMAVYNTAGDILAEYHLDVFSEMEPEGVFVDRTTKKLLVSGVDHVVYRLE